MMENKSVNDIIAELRSVAFSIKVHDAMMPEVYDILCGVAFRLEAAWKREKADAESDALAVGGIVEAARTTEKTSAVGNAAATREALVAIQKLVQANIAADEFDDLEPLKEYVQIRDICNAALSAPARNCDLFATVSDARKAFNEWLKHNTPISFGGWLLRLAAERKGEGDGSK